MKLTQRDRAQMACMMARMVELMRELPSNAVLTLEQRKLVDRMSDVRNGLREVLALA